MSPARRALVPERFPWLDPSRYTFSLGVQVGRSAWLSGQTASALDPSTGRVDVRGDLAGQAAVAWDKVEAVLAAGGLSLADVRRVVEYVPAVALADRPALDSVRVARFGPAGPPVVTVVVDGLVRRPALVEVEVVADADPAGGDLVHLPGVLPLDEAGEVVAPGDLVGQARVVLERAAALLADARLDLGHVVKTVDATTPATRSRYRATGAVRRELLGPAFPAATGVLVPALPHPGAAIALDVIASRHPRRVLDPGTGSDRLTFNPGVRAGDHVFVSGTTAHDPATGQVVAPGDVAGQAAFVYGQIARVLAVAGATPADLVKTVEYVAPAGFDGYRGVAAVRERVLPRPFPASTGLRVAGLLRPEWLVEVDAVAVVGGGGRP